MGVGRPIEPIWVYDVVFAVDTVNTGETVKAYGKDMVETLLKKKYLGCEITIHEITEIRREL